MWTNNLRHVQKWSRESEDPLLYIHAREVWDEPPDPSSSAFQVNGPCARPTKWQTQPIPGVTPTYSTLAPRLGCNRKHANLDWVLFSESLKYFFYPKKHRFI